MLGSLGVGDLEVMSEDFESFLSVLWNPKPSISHPIYLFSVTFLPPRETPDISLPGNALKSL